QSAFQARAELPQQRVAGLMTEGVVDLLEAVEVEKAESERNPFALGHQESLIEPVAEQDAIGKTRQEIVEGLPLESLEMSHSLARVPQHRHPMSGPILTRRNRRQGDLERVRGAVLALRVHLSTKARTGSDRAPHRFDRLLFRFGDPEDLKAVAEDVGGRQAGETAEPVVDENDARFARFRRENQDAFDRVVHRRFQERERLLDPFSVRDDGREREGHHRSDSHEALEKQQRFVDRLASEWTHPAQRPPDGNSREKKDGRRRIAGTKAESRPKENRDAEELERVALGGQWEGKSEDEQTDQNEGSE